MSRKPKAQVPDAQWSPYNPDTAGLDIGASEIWVAVPADRDPTPVRSFSTFTPDLRALAEWLVACRVKRVATPARTAGAGGEHRRVLDPDLRVAGSPPV